MFLAFLFSNRKQIRSSIEVPPCLVIVCEIKFSTLNANLITVFFCMEAYVAALVNYHIIVLSLIY